MTAKEARELAARKSTEISDILEKIKIAAKNGKTELKLPYAISDLALEHLRTLGYDINNVSHHEILIIIKW